MVTALSEGVGGPVGERVGRHRWWTPVRVVLALTALCFALGMVQKASCYDQTWQDSDARLLPPVLLRPALPLHRPRLRRAELALLRRRAGAGPVRRDGVPRRHLLLRVGRGLGDPLAERVARHLAPLRRRQWAGSPSDPEVSKEIRYFVIVNAVGFAVAALLAAWLLSGVNPRRPWDAALFALSPALALSALVNWDMLAVVLVAGALWAWARDRPVLTGVLIGLGTATKLFPLFLLGGDPGDLPARPAGARLRADAPARPWRRGCWPTCRRTSPGAEQWRVFWHFNADRGRRPRLVLAGRGAGEGHRDPGAHDQRGLVGVLRRPGAWVSSRWACGRPQTPRLAQLGFLVVAGFLLVNKVYSPQYVLWLLPLAVMARPRWRDQLVWQGGEVFYFVMVWWYLGGELDPASGGDAGFYWLAIVVRMLAELYLVAIVARDVLQPVARPGRPDAAGTPPERTRSADRSSPWCWCRTSSRAGAEPHQLVDDEGHETPPRPRPAPRSPAAARRSAAGAGGPRRRSCGAGSRCRRCGGGTRRGRAGRPRRRRTARPAAYR